MSMFGRLESGLYKCPLRALNEDEKHYQHLKKDVELAREEKRIPQEDLDKLEKSIIKGLEDIKRCKEGYDFSGCENCTNEYYLTGHSVKGCDNLPVRAAI